MLECMVTFSYDKYLKLSELFRTGVTEMNDTKSRAKFPLVAFSLVSKGSLDFLEQNGDII